jgi:hypothetical protein
MASKRSVGDRPRHHNYSTVKDLHLIPFGFGINVTEETLTMLAAGNVNPPQLFAEPGADDQEVILRCPKGHPNRVWLVAWCSGGITAGVSDYSTITDGELAIDLSAAPAGDATIQGFLCYGGISSGGHGAIAAAPVKPSGVRSYGQHTTDSLLKQLMVYPVGWTTDADGVVTEIRGPLGTHVTRVDAGAYRISFPHKTPFDFEGLWAKIFSASDGRAADFSYDSTGNETTVTVTFTDDTDMGDGDRASVMFAGPVSHYPPNYGGASGGVHPNLQTRHVHGYRNYIQKGLVREGVMLPFRVGIAASTAGPTGPQGLPPGMRIARTGAGVYALYVGKLPPGGLIAECVTLANGAEVGVTAVNEATGVLTITAPDGDPGATVLNGFLFLSNIAPERSGFEVDTTPQVLSATIPANGLTMTVVFDRPMDETVEPDGTSLTLDGTASAFDSVEFTSPTTMVVTLDAAAEDGETITMDLAADAVRSLDGIYNVEIEDFAVTNNSTVT